MPLDLNGYEITDNEISDFCQADRKSAHQVWLPHWKKVLKKQDEAYLYIVDDVHEEGVKPFVPRGYSIAQAMAARATQMASLSMIIHDFDGNTTKEGLAELVKETYQKLLQAILCEPERLTAFGSRNSEEELSEHEKQHGQHVLSCLDMGEPDWAECRIDYSTYAVEHDDPYGFLHSLSEDMFILHEIEKRVSQYLDWGSNKVEDDDASTEELYENTELGRANLKYAPNPLPQLSDEGYEDIATASAKAIMLSMAACENVMADDSIGVTKLKEILVYVNEQLKWFFDYYHDVKIRKGITS